MSSDLPHRSDTNPERNQTKDEDGLLLENQIFSMAQNCDSLVGPQSLLEGKMYFVIHDQ